MRSISNLITATDFLAPPYRISYNLKTSKKTCFNGFLSLSIILSAVLFAFVIGKELILREQPSVSVSQVEVDQPTVSLYESPVAFSINDLAGLRYLNLDKEFMENVKLTALEYSVFYVGDNIIPRYRTLILETCKEEFMKSSVWEQGFANLKPELVLCINPFKKIEENGEIIEEPVVFSGSSGQNNSKTLMITLSVCTNESQACKRTKEKLNQKTILGYGSTRYYINNRDYENPKKSKIITSSVPLNLDLTSIVNFDYDITRLIDDKGIAFGSQRLIEFSNFREQNKFYELRRESEPLLVVMTVGVKDIVDVVERRYMKISEFLANLGGFVKATVIIARIFANISSKYAFYRFAVSEKQSVSPKKISSEGKIFKDKEAKKEKPRQYVGLIEFVWGMVFHQTAKKNGTDREALYSFFDAKVLELRLQSIEDRLEKRIDQDKSSEDKLIRE